MRDPRDTATIESLNAVLDWIGERAMEAYRDHAYDDFARYISKFDELDDYINTRLSHA